MSSPAVTGRRLAVLGSPISHSLSPRLHRAAYSVLDLDYTYEAADVTSEKLKEFLASCGPEWLGLSLTMPLKHSIRHLVDDHDELSTLTGSTNTVLFSPLSHGTQKRGFNTDVGGIVRAFAGQGIRSASEVAILGGGATAASALIAAAQLGAEHASVIVRSPQKTEFLTTVAHQSGLAVTILPLTAESLEVTAATITVSTLPGGVAPVELFARSSLPSRSVLLDVAYHPWPSALAKLWTDQKQRVVSGLDMLVHQALLQIRIFVAGDPTIPLEGEARVLETMFASVGGDALPASV